MDDRSIITNMAIMFSFGLLLFGVIWGGTQLKATRAELGICVQLLDPNVSAVPVE